MRSTGVIERATSLFDGPMNASTFLQDVENHRASALRSGDGVITANLSRHKPAAGVRAAHEAVGADLWYRPPYSPDFYPIEKPWSEIRTGPKRVAARTRKGVLAAMLATFRSVTTTECGNGGAAGGYDPCVCKSL